MLDATNIFVVSGFSWFHTMDDRLEHMTTYATFMGEGAYDDAVTVAKSWLEKYDDVQLFTGKFEGSQIVPDKEIEWREVIDEERKS